MPFQLGSRVHFWHHVRLVLAALVAIVLVTVGCGQPPRQVAMPVDRVTQRRAQLVEVFNVGVGLDASTGGMFMFSDLQAARQLPEASSSFLVALDAYTLFNGGQSSDIDVQVVIPGGGQCPLRANVPHLNASYDWSEELGRIDRDIPPELFGAIVAKAGAITLSATASPGEAVALAMEDGAYTTGASWGDVRLMLAAISVWARQQPLNFWTASGTGGGIETVMPRQVVGVALNTDTQAITAISQDQPPASGSVVVRLGSVMFPSSSSTPSGVVLETVFPDGASTRLTLDIAGLDAPDWRYFLNEGSGSLQPDQVAQMATTVQAARNATPNADFWELFQFVRGEFGQQAVNEASGILVAAAVANQPGPPPDVSFSDTNTVEVGERSLSLPYALRTDPASKTIEICEGLCVAESKSSGFIVTEFLSAVVSAEDVVEALKLRVTNARWRASA